jgi:hypothetical protein
MTYIQCYNPGLHESLIPSSFVSYPWLSLGWNWEVAGPKPGREPSASSESQTESSQTEARHRIQELDLWDPWGIRSVGTVTMIFRSSFLLRRSLWKR